MANHSLRTVVATTLDVIHNDAGYIAPNRSTTTNTQTKVLATLKKTPIPEIDPMFWQLADEVIGFFRIADTLPNWKDILAMPDGAMYKICLDTAKKDEIESLSFNYAVAMPNLYSNLKPAKPKMLNPLKSEAKLIKPGEFLGTLNVEDRFFVKLVKVGAVDATKGGTLFVVNDRSGNVGMFYDVPSKLEGKVWLGDCFAIHATPHRQHAEPNGEKQTLFRGIKIILDTLIPGKGKIDPANDATGGKFTK